MYQKDDRLWPKSESGKDSKTMCEEQKTKKACSTSNSTFHSCEWLNSTKCVSAVRPEEMQSKPAPPYYNLRLRSFLQQYDVVDRDDDDLRSRGRSGLWSRDGEYGVGLDLFVEHNINTFNPKKRVFPINYPWSYVNDENNFIGPTAVVKGCSLHLPEN